jgi:hypothetical protein
MSQLDGSDSGLYTKTLNGLDSINDATIANLTITGNLIVGGTTSLQGDLDMNFNFIQNLPLATAPGEAVEFTQLAGAGTGVFLKLDGSDTMAGNIQMGANQITGLADGTLAQDAVSLNQLTTASGTFLKLDGTTTMGGNIAVGANQITGLADGTLATDGATYGQTILRDGTNTMLGTLDLNSNNITNGLAITADSVNITGISTAGVGSVALNGLSYTYPALAPTIVGQTLQNTTIVSPYTLAWTTPATPVIAVDSGTGQTNLAIMGTAPILSGAVGVVQPIYGGTIAVPSARINMDTGALTCPNVVLTSGVAPQIYVKSSTTQNGIILGDAALSPNICSVFGNGLLAVEATTDVELSYGLGGAIASKCGFSFNSAEVMRVDDEGYIWAVNPSTAVLTQTTLPKYWRQHYSWTTRQNNIQASGTNNWFCCPNTGGYNPLVTGYRPDLTITAGDFDNLATATTGGGAQYCIYLPTAGVLKEVKVICPFASSNLTCNLSRGGVVLTNAGLIPMASGVFAPSGANTGHTLPIVSSAFNADNWIVFRVSEIYNAGQHAQGDQFYNISVVLDFEYT